MCLKIDWASYSWKGIYVSVLHEVFIKTRRENVDLPRAKRWNSSFYCRKDNNEVKSEDHLKEFGAVLGHPKQLKS